MAEEEQNITLEVEETDNSQAEAQAAAEEEAAKKAAEEEAAKKAAEEEAAKKAAEEEAARKAAEEEAARKAAEEEAVRKAAEEEAARKAAEEEAAKKAAEEEEAKKAAEEEAARKAAEEEDLKEQLLELEKLKKEQEKAWKSGELSHTYENVRKDEFRKRSANMQTGFMSMTKRSAHNIFEPPQQQKLIKSNRQNVHRSGMMFGFRR